MKKGFPDTDSMDVFEEATRTLIGNAFYYVSKLGPLTPKGDIPIFCQLVVTLFINGVRDYIEGARKERGDPPSFGLECYLDCVEILRSGVMDKMVLSLFENPPEEWTERCKQ